MSDATDNRFYREKQEQPSSKELAYRDALARIRQVCRSDAKDFETATINRRQLYDIANMALDSGGDLFVTAQPPAASHPYMLNGARFKLSFNAHGETFAFAGYEKELFGRWVALVDATDNQHMQSVTKEATSSMTLKSQERHALFIAAQEARDPTAVKLLLELYDRTSPTKSEPTCDDGLRAQECPTCHGVGGGVTRDGIEVDCLTCNGDGSVLKKLADILDGTTTEKTEMPGGKGADETTAATEPVRRPSSAPSDETNESPVCSTCKGTGVLKTGTVYGGIAETVACDDCGDSESETESRHE